MTQDFDAIDLLCQNATSGPWEVGLWSQSCFVTSRENDPPILVADTTGTLVGPSRSTVYADAEFIAQARTIVPELVVELRTARDHVRIQLSAANDAIVEADHYEAENTELRTRIASMDDPNHYAQFGENGWTLQHPMSCRPNLLACPYNDAMRDTFDRPYDGEPGRYHVELNPATQFVRVLGRALNPENPA